LQASNRGQVCQRVKFELYKVSTVIADDVQASNRGQVCQSVKFELYTGSTVIAGNAAPIDLILLKKFKNDRLADLTPIFAIIGAACLIGPRRRGT